MATEAAARSFFSSSQFAVVGASSDPNKFGHKIFNWYIQHSLPVTPINPTSPSITAVASPTSASPQTYSTLPNLASLPSPSTTSISIVTPPKVTLKALHEAKDLGIAAVWLQPGSFDDVGLAFALEEWKDKALGGDGGRGSEGWCVLVDGERALNGAKREKAEAEGKL